MHFFLAAGISNIDISFPVLGAEALHLIRLRRRCLRLGGFPMSGSNPECVTVSRSAAENGVVLIGCRTLRSQGSLHPATGGCCRLEAPRAGIHNTTLMRLSLCNTPLCCEHLPRLVRYKVIVALVGMCSEQCPQVCWDLLVTLVQVGGRRLVAKFRCNHPAEAVEFKAMDKTTGGSPSRTDPP